MQLTPRQLEILQHALGLNKYGKCGSHEDPRQCRDSHSDLPGHRNRFCAGADDEVTCRQLVALGFMVQHPRTEWLPYYNCSVTEAGRKAVRDESPAAPRLTRSQKNYRAFLSADTGMSFLEWLKRPKRENSWEGWG